MKTYHTINMYHQSMSHNNSYTAIKNITFSTSDNVNSLSHQDEQFIQAALDEAQQSPCNMKHGAIAVASGKIIGRGYNHYRSQSRDGIIQHSCTCHAEMAAIRQVLHSIDHTHGHYQHSIKVA